MALHDLRTNFRVNHLSESDFILKREEQLSNNALKMVLALVGDSQCLPLLWRRIGHPTHIIASSNVIPALSVLHVRGCQ